MNSRTLAIVLTAVGSFVALAFAADAPSNTAEKAKSTGYRPSIVVYKSQHCDCCMLWVAHLQANRFNVSVENVDDLGRVKKRFGIPRDKDSCHTAEIDGYFIEGHVPAEDIKRLIKLKPDAKGLIVPGMPIGSPGMEQGRMFQPYDVLLVDKAGNMSVFSHYDK